MRTMTKIACRTMGTAGMGLAFYEAWREASHKSKAESQNQQSKHIENVYFNTRNTDKFSYTDKAMQKKAFDLRTGHGLYSLWGGIKGGVKGTLDSLGSNLFAVACSAMAILSKGTFAKIGAIGVGLDFGYKIMRSCFGLGKKHPMN